MFSSFTDLLPDGAVTVDTDGLDGDGGGELHRAEAAQVAAAAPERRAQFTRGRLCARSALSQLGVDDFALLAGESREPIWPAGIVGSLSHCDSYSVASVARASRIAAVGLRHRNLLNRRTVHPHPPPLAARTGNPIRSTAILRGCTDVVGGRSGGDPRRLQGAPSAA